MSILRFEKVTKYYGRVKALNQFDWEVERGCIHAILGHNGSGKTTSFLIANGLIPYDSGAVFLLGKKLKNVSRKELSQIGFLTDKLRLYKELSVLDNLSFFCELYSVKQKGKWMSEIVDVFGLADFLYKDVKDLSTGMYKKAAIAITMASNPEILFLDEPFSGLDPVFVKDISKILTYYKEEMKKTIIVASHNLNEIEIVSEYVTILKEGRKIVSDSLVSLMDCYNIKKGFYIVYREDGCEKNIAVKDHTALYSTLKILKDNKNYIVSVSDKKVSLDYVYNQIYQKQ